MIALAVRARIFRSGFGSGIFSVTFVQGNRYADDGRILRFWWHQPQFDDGLAELDKNRYEISTLLLA
jgi:hypothetical protein